jgi:serine/threonine-protein kinase
VAEAAAHEALAELCECQGKLSKSIEHLRKAQALRERISQRDARNKLAQVEVRAAMEAAKKDAEIHKLRFVELHGQRSRRRVSMVEGPQLGNYQLLERLASGGMGEVWRARHRMLKREAAIKVIRRDVLASGSDEGDVLLRRFEREARATSALKSPHTVEIHDFGITEDGTFYYVMELLDGLSLHALVERYGPQPARRVAYILSQVCESLAEAHRNQLIHRDIKPSNILLCRYGLKRDFVKVLDFGLVKSTMRLGEGAADLTAAAVVGTPAFMPPEVAQPDVSFDPRSDIYALGCVGYWLLSAKLVFEAATPLQMVLAHVQTPAEPPSARTEMPIPADLERVVMTCLSKDPDDRPQSAEALSLQLDECSMGDRWSEARAAEWWNVHSPSTLVSSSELAQAVSEERLFLPMSAVRRVKGALRKWFVMAPALLILAGFGAWGLWLTIQALLASR